MYLGNQAAAVAGHVLAEHWDNQLPVDPARIAHALGVTVKPSRGSPYSGQFYFELGNAPVIVVETTEPVVRQRFTIAHELGHLLLEHGSAFRDPARNFSVDIFDPTEADANRFAAELLMPAQAVRFHVLNKRTTDLTLLAARFGVSELAMQYRLKNLGLL